MAQKIPGGATALIYRQGTQHEVCHIAPGTSFPYELPVKPHPFAIWPDIAVALMRVAVDQTPRPGLGVFECGQPVEQTNETIWFVQQPFGQDVIIPLLCEIDFHPTVPIGSASCRERVVQYV